MPAYTIPVTFPFFTDKFGKAIDQGRIFIGTANQNPETAPLTVYWDSALTQVAQQPIRTIAGYPVRNGSIAKLFIDEDSYSVTLRDKNNNLIYSTTRVRDFVPTDLINYTSTLTGAVARTLSAKLGDVASVKDFGAKGDGATDDDDAFQAAADSGAKFIYMPGGTYRLPNDQLTIPAGVSFVGDHIDNTILDMSGNAQSVGILAAGAGLTALPDLSASPAQGDVSLTFASTPTLSVGDVFVIYNTSNGSFNGARTFYRAGEYCQVHAISGSVVTLNRPLFAAYTAAAIDLYKVSGTALRLSNFTLTGDKSLTTAMQLRFGVRSYIENVRVDESANTEALTLDRCFDCGLNNVVATMTAAAAGEQNAIGIGNSQSVIATSCRASSTRHGMNMGGRDLTGAVPNRDVFYEHCIISTSEDDRAADIHGNAEHCGYRNCEINGGVQIGGNNIALQNNKIRASNFTSGAGTDSRVCIRLTEMLGFDFDIIGNTVEGYLNNAASNNGNLIYAPAASTTVRGGVLRIADNTFRMRLTANQTVRMAFIDKVSAAAVTDAKVIWENNTVDTGETFRCTQPNAIHIKGDTVNGFHTVEIRGGSCNGAGFRLEECANVVVQSTRIRRARLGLEIFGTVIEHVELAAVDIRDTLLAGVWVSANGGFKAHKTFVMSGACTVTNNLTTDGSGSDELNPTLPGTAERSSVYVIKFDENYIQGNVIGSHGNIQQDQPLYVDPESAQTNTIANITQANPGVVTTGTNHHFIQGDICRIRSVVGMVEVNGKMFRVNVTASDQFELQNLDGTNYDTTSHTAYSSSGQVSIDRIVEIGANNYFGVGKQKITRSIFDHVRNFAEVRVSTINIVGATPTEAELTTAFGAPDDLGPGFIGLVTDNGGFGGATNNFLCWVNPVLGANQWQYVATTKAP